MIAKVAFSANLLLSMPDPVISDVRHLIAVVAKLPDQSHNQGMRRGY